MIKVTKQISDIALNPLSETEKQKIITDSFGELAVLNANNLDLFLTQLQITIKNYLIEYQQNWQLFEHAFQLINTIKSSSTNNLNSSYMNLRNQRGSVIYAQNFIRTLEKGTILLDYIRQMLTGQIITTNFTIKGSEKEIYLAEKSEIPYKLVLSTYGASGNNFVSLAYAVDTSIAIQSLIANLNEEEKKAKLITQTDIYERLMTVKGQYLADLRSKNPKNKYQPFFDSKDAEIFDLFKQRLESHELSKLNQALTKSTYIKMRKSMGGRGGYRTSSTQLGDIGLIQDKLITQSTKRVNFARQTLIYNRFKAMDQALSSMDLNEIKQIFLKLFTEKQSRVGNNLSKMVNAEAKKMIRLLFQ